MQFGHRSRRALRRARRFPNRSAARSSPSGARARPRARRAATRRSAAPPVPADAPLRAAPAESSRGSSARSGDRPCPDCRPAARRCCGESATLELGAGSGAGAVPRAACSAAFAGANPAIETSGSLRSSSRDEHGLAPRRGDRGQFVRFERGIEAPDALEQRRMRREQRGIADAVAEQHVRDFLGVGVGELASLRASPPIFFSAPAMPAGLARELHRGGVGEVFALARDAALIRRRRTRRRSSRPRTSASAEDHDAGRCRGSPRRRRARRSCGRSWRCTRMPNSTPISRMLRRMSPFSTWLNSCAITPCSSSRLSLSSAPRVTRDRGVGRRVAGRERVDAGLVLEHVDLAAPARRRRSPSSSTTLRRRRVAKLPRVRRRRACRRAARATAPPPLRERRDAMTAMPSSDHDDRRATRGRTSRAPQRSCRRSSCALSRTQPRTARPSRSRPRSRAPRARTGTPSSATAAAPAACARRSSFGRAPSALQPAAPSQVNDRPSALRASRSDSISSSCGRLEREHAGDDADRETSRAGCCSP